MIGQQWFSRSKQKPREIHSQRELCFRVVLRG
jgi:hypothetical protein